MREREVVAYECLDRVKLENGSHSPLFGRTEEGSLPCKQYNRSKELGLNAEYTFDTFVVGDSNKFAKNFFTFLIISIGRENRW